FNNIKVVGTPEIIEKARVIISNQDKPQKPVMISIKIWEVTKSQGFNVDEFLKKPEEQRFEMAKLLSAPRVLTLPGRKASIEIGKKNKKELENGIELEIFPVTLPDNLIQIDVRGKIVSEVFEAQNKLSQQKKFASTFVIKPQYPFGYEVQGGNSPMVLEFFVTRPE
ncbi:hypothetical protein HYY75_08140, partial [bacterium]|nr:hypothetical protein [bacterium]